MLSILYFTAEWCGPCRAFRPVITEMQNKYMDRAEIKKIDIDQDRETTENYGIRSVPTLVFLVDGVEVYRNSGVLLKPYFENIINQYVQ